MNGQSSRSIHASMQQYVQTISHSVSGPATVKHRKEESQRRKNSKNYAKRVLTIPETVRLLRKYMSIAETI